MVSNEINDDFLITDPAFLKRPALKVRSVREIWVFAILIGIAVFAIALGIQWVIYDRFLHEDGLRFVGSVISGVIAAILAQRLETASRNQRLAEVRRLEVIALMNHHIRNALQTIVYGSGANPSTASIRSSVDRIEWVLSDVLPGVNEDQQSQPERNSTDRSSGHRAG